MDIAKLAATRSTCTRRSVGAVIVRNNNILFTGYNGAPTGIKHCEEETCIRNVRSIPSGTQLDICIGLHAEQNAIAFAAKEGIKLNGTILYTTTSPCAVCAKLIASSGISRVVYLETYRDTSGIDFLNKCGVSCTKL